MGEKRGRVWGGISYPDSMPDDWLVRLKETHIPMAISPLHAGDESDTKEHYHILMCFEGNKSVAQVQQVMDEVNGTRPIRIESIGGYARYLCHLDEGDDKPRYDTADVITLAGFDYDQYLQPSGTELSDLIREIDMFVLEHEISEVHELVEYALQHEPDWYRALQSPAQLSRAQHIIRSLRYSHRRAVEDCKEVLRKKEN